MWGLLGKSKVKLWKFMLKVDNIIPLQRFVVSNKRVLPQSHTYVLVNVCTANSLFFFFFFIHSFFHCIVCCLNLMFRSSNFELWHWVCFLSRHANSKLVFRKTLILKNELQFKISFPKNINTEKRTPNRVRSSFQFYVKLYRIMEKLRKLKEI